MGDAVKYVREYVDVNVDFCKEGLMLPRSMVWEDGRRYEIDFVRDVRYAPAQKTGGYGERYTVMIGGHERYLFFEPAENGEKRQTGKWFVERKVAV